MKKEELRLVEIEYKNKIKEVPKSSKKFWQRQLKSIQRKLYGL